MLTQMTLTGFCEELASDSPAPGGGSVAALSGALSAGLVGMVCRLTIGKKGFEDQTEILTEVKASSDALRHTLDNLVDKDTDAFNQVMAAFKLPRSTDEEKASRSRAIQSAFCRAAAVPMETVTCCSQVLLLAEKIADTANPNCLSDLGVAVQSAWAGLNGALMNVRINLPSIKDEDLREETRQKADALLASSQEIFSALSPRIFDRL